jgi:hypothetical protein
MQYIARSLLAGELMKYRKSMASEARLTALELAKEIKK